MAGRMQARSETGHFQVSALIRNDCARPNRREGINRAIRISSIGLAAALSPARGHQDGASAGGANADSAVAAAHEIAAAQASARAAKADAAIHDACSLVSLADAESILGTPAKLSEHAQDDKQSLHCNYGSVDQPHGFNGLMVGIETEEDANEAKTFMAVQRQMWSANEALPGIGDDAFLVVNKQPGAGEDVPAEMVDMLPDQQMLFVIKGARVISLTTNYMGKSRPTDSLKALAKKLADHF